ncbi:MAG: hypothetical protein H6750_15300 [Nitrospiraceae bacterium]|nr:hypothetical protein [Nitrospira sp.]MCB9775675.1 hypothetical protein [Nitrospiraceae bacterium]
MVTDHGSQMPPAVPAAGNVRHIHRPPLNTLECLAAQTLCQRAGRPRLLMDQPPFDP